MSLLLKTNTEIRIDTEIIKLKNKKITITYLCFYLRNSRLIVSVRATTGYYFLGKRLAVIDPVFGCSSRVYFQV